MGKIIRNGIKYSGTTNSADKINYNNTLSGLEAETAQEAFDELNTKIKNGGNIEYLTQEEYDALPDTKLSNDVEYRITNANESVNAARDWAYDNSESGLEAETVQDAIDEVNENVSTLNESLVAENNQPFQFAYDSASGKYGYKAKVEGADTFFPFSEGSGKLFQLFGVNTSSDMFLLSKGTYVLETIAGCYSAIDTVPYINLYRNDGKLLRTAARTVYRSTVYNSVAYTILHSVEAIIVEEDTEVYLHHTEGNWSQFAKSLIYNYKPNTILASLVPFVGGEALCGSNWSECEAYKAFDGSIASNNGWSSANGHIPDWIGYRFEKKVCVKKVAIRNTGYGNQQVKTFRIEASDNGTDWVSITDVITNSNLGAEVETSYMIDNDNEYLYYRVYCLTSNGTACVSFREVQFFGDLTYTNRPLGV